MISFSPEISARALIPRDLLGQASSLHFTLHLQKKYVEAALCEAAGGDFHWVEAFHPDAASYEEIGAFVKERNWNEKVFRKCTITFDTGKFCLVPSAFFDAEKAKDLLSFSCGSVEDVHWLEVPELEAYIVLEWPSWISELTRRFPNGRFFPSAFLFLKYAASLAEKGSDCFFLYHTPQFLLIGAFSDRKLQLLNAHQVHGDEDILYHVSNTAMRLNKDFENIELKVFEAVEDSSLLLLLKQYNANTTLVLNDQGKKFPGLTFISQLHVLCA